MECLHCSTEMSDYTFCPKCGEPNVQKEIPDLFGEMRPVKEFLNKEERNGNESKYQAFKRENNYRRGDIEIGLSIYHRCKYCTHSIIMHYHGKVYCKCRLMGISNSEATDIRRRNVCDIFKYHGVEPTDDN